MSNSGKNGSMIDYGAFQIYTAPFTGRSYFDFLAKTYGFPCEKTEIPFRVTIVRHPLDWLIKIWGNADFLTVPKENHELRFLTELGHQFRDNFPRFIREITHSPGIVGKSFGKYHADSAVRFEDLPWAALELFKSFKDQSDQSKIEEILEIRMIPDADMTSFSSRDLEIFRSALRDSETGFMEQFEYV